MDVDVTYLVQLGVFLLCLVTLNGILLKPFLRVILEREARTEGAREQAELLTKSGNEAQAAYQARMREARVLAHRAQQALRATGRDSERKLLAELRDEVADTLAKARRDIAASENKARAELQTDLDTLARELVEKILGREVRA